MEETFCPKCGEPISENTFYCAKCGANVREADTFSPDARKLRISTWLEKNYQSILLIVVGVIFIIVGTYFSELSFLFLQLIAFLMGDGLYDTTPDKYDNLWVTAIGTLLVMGGIYGFYDEWKNSSYPI